MGKRYTVKSSKDSPDTVMSEPILTYFVIHIEGYIQVENSEDSPDTVMSEPIPTYFVIHIEGYT